MNSILQKLGILILLFCAFATRAQEEIKLLGELPSDVAETSGLIYFNGVLITHNDSGNEPILYELDTLNLTIKRSVRISNVENTDWEAISQDEDFIYIGDFGNNLGTRRDLAVHKISKQAYLDSDEVVATTINFSYVDQTDFSNNGNSDWDAEAFFVLADQLIILTKQWQSQGSVAYTVPKEPGTYVASKLGTIENIGLVTDASY
ncbi:MAG: T9SS C-terminal target domain-containing protein, partial [Maribacter sp.]